MNKIDNTIKYSIDSNINRIEEIINSGIFNNPSNIFFKSALIEVLILMRDLTKKSDFLLNKKLESTELIVIDENLSIYNVSDLIRVFRDCFCHSETNKKKFNNSILDYNIFINDNKLSINMGKHFLYIDEHIITSFNEIKKIFSHL